MKHHIIAGIILFFVGISAFNAPQIHHATSITLTDWLGSAETNPIIYLDLESELAGVKFLPRLAVPPIIADLVKPVHVENGLGRFVFHAHYGQGQE